MFYVKMSLTLSYTSDTTYVHYYLATYQVSLGCEEAVLGEFGLNGLPCLLAKFCKGIQF